MPLSSTRLSLRLAGLLLAAGCAPSAFAQQPAPAVGGVLVSQGTLDGYTGRYVTATGVTLNVWREGAVLKLQPDGGEAASLVPDSETTFHVSGMDAQVEFVFDAVDQVGHLLLTQGGAAVKAIHQ